MRNHKDLVRVLDEAEANIAMKAAAIRMASNPNVSRKDVASSFGISGRTLKNWVHRYENEGVDGLRHKKGAGRPSDISLKRLKRHAKALAKKAKLTTKTFIRRVRLNENRIYSLSHARKLLVKIGFSWMAEKLVYDYAAKPEELKKWQGKNIPEIRRLENKGYTLVSQDECSVSHYVLKGKKHWYDKIPPPIMQNSSRHEKTYLYGVLAGDSTHLMVQEDKLNSSTFVNFLKLVRAKYGKIVMMLDNASYHHTKIVKEYIDSTNGDVILKYLPAGAPQLNAIEECWRQLKYAVVTVEYYATLRKLKDAITAYLRSTVFRHNPYTYLYRCI